MKWNEIISDTDSVNLERLEKLIYFNVKKLRDRPNLICNVLCFEIYIMFDSN